jgi:hypothetical protein
MKHSSVSLFAPHRDWMKPMSTDVMVYVPKLNKNLLPKIRSRLADFGMDCEFHPEFSFDQESDEGFLPIKMQVRSQNADLYGNIAVLTGFELSIEDYDYDAEQLDKQRESQKPGFLAKLFGKKVTSKEEPGFVARNEFDDVLKTCHKQISIFIHASPTGGYRIGMYFAAILAELTDGIVYDPQADEYFDSRAAINRCPDDVLALEKVESKLHWSLVPFQSWTE